MTEALDLVRELVAIPGPPGQEGEVRNAVAAHAGRLGCARETDARGNLLLGLPGCGTGAGAARHRGDGASR